MDNKEERYEFGYTRRGRDNGYAKANETLEEIQSTMRMLQL